MKLHEHFLICFTLLASLCSGAGETTSTLASDASSTASASGIAAELQRIASSHEGVMGIYCRHLGTGEVYEVNADEPFPTASTIKVAVMAAALDLLMRGEGPYDSYYDTRTYDASTSTGGSGFMRNYQDGTKMELKELVHLMMTVSDNIATNMICEWIGLDKVNGWLSKCGFQETRIYSTVGGKKVYDAEGREKWGLGKTTPREMANLMASIAKGRAGTTSATDEMLRVLGHQYFDGSIPAGVPPMVYVGSKGGSLNASRSDAGIVAAPTGTYVLAVYTKDNEDKSWGRTNKAEAAIREVSEVLWRHFNPESEWRRPEGAEEL